MLGSPKLGLRFQGHGSGFSALTGRAGGGWPAWQWRHQPGGGGGRLGCAKSGDGIRDDGSVGCGSKRLR